MNNVKIILNGKFFYPIFLLFTFVFLYYQPISGTLEADSYYHLAISKITASQGLIRSLPQLEDMGWADYFPDKEFLFHQLTRIGYSLSGDLGVQLICNLLASFVIVLLVLICETFCSRLLSLSLTFLMLMDVNFFFRLTLIRPHLAGILFSLIIMYGLIKKSRSILVAGSLLFPLFYHAFYLPLMFMGAFCLTDKTKYLKFVLLYGLIPLIIGLIINPYFPSNLVMMWLGIKIAFSSSQATGLGFETRPMGFVKSIYLIGSLIVLTLALVPFLKKIYSEKSNILPLFLITITLEALFFFSPRSLEYLVPVFIILAATTVPYFVKSIRYFHLFLCLILLSINIRYIGNFFVKDEIINLRSKDLIQVVSALPRNKIGKVFNCEWENGSYILYARPNMKLVELLDPNFIYMHNPNMAKIKLVVPILSPDQLYKTLTEVFKANYVFCGHPHMMNTMNNDKRFIKMAEGKLDNKTSLYEIIRD